MVVEIAALLLDLDDISFFERRAKNSAKAFVYMELALIGIILNTLAHCGTAKGNIRE